jgi:CysZ protein
MLVCAVLAVILVIGVVITITWTTVHLIDLDTGWLDTLLTGIVGLLTGIGGWFMLPSLTVLIAGLFQEITIQRVDRIYYPKAVRCEDLKFWSEIWHDIRFTVWAVLLNLLVLPLYLLGIGFVVSILLNSYLLGREFFESAAGYHIGKVKAKELGRQHRKTMYGGGFIITVMTLLPVLNLFVPLFAVVWMVHVYHAICAKE